MGWVGYHSDPARSTLRVGGVKHQHIVQLKTKPNCRHKRMENQTANIHAVVYNTYMYVLNYMVFRISAYN